jgi:REP element-mobilizing transposase RayT
LCGVDKISGRDFSHRRKWIERRILELGEIFTVSIYAYAVMTNHYHIVLRVEPRPLTDVEVVDRWLLLCPVTAVNTSQQYCHEARKFAILADQEKLAELRLRLCSLSWFMRFLNEPLARMANLEDRCKGRFWEGRFKSQHLLDEAAVLACMVYVDLNPIRAGIATTPADSNFTSLQRRIRDNKINVFSQPIKAANSSRSPLPFEPLSLGDYLHLVRWTQGSQSTRKRSIPFGVSYSLLCNHTDSDQWFRDHLPCPGENQYRTSINKQAITRHPSTNDRSSSRLLILVDWMIEAYGKRLFRYRLHQLPPSTAAIDYHRYGQCPTAILRSNR